MTCARYVTAPVRRAALGSIATNYTTGRSATLRVGPGGEGGGHFATLFDFCCRYRGSLRSHKSYLSVSAMYITPEGRDGKTHRELTSSVTWFCFRISPRYKRTQRYSCAHSSSEVRLSRTPSALATELSVLRLCKVSTALPC